MWPPSLQQLESCGRITLTNATNRVSLLSHSLSDRSRTGNEEVRCWNVICGSRTEWHNFRQKSLDDLLKLLLWGHKSRQSADNDVSLWCVVSRTHTSSHIYAVLWQVCAVKDFFSLITYAYGWGSCGHSESPWIQRSKVCIKKASKEEPCIC